MASTGASPRRQFPAGTRIQSLVFDRRFFSPSEARSWASAHGFRAPAAEVYENSLRLRQASPERFKKGTFRMMSLDAGVQAVVASPLHPGTFSRKEKARGGGVGVAWSRIQRKVKARVRRLLRRRRSAKPRKKRR